MGENKTEIEVPDLDWVKLRKDMDGDNQIETYFDRIKRKFSDNPLVGVGCVATVGALSFGLWNFRQGNQKMSQYMMRARVIAQGFTISVAVISLMMAAKKTADQQEKNQKS